MTNFKLLTTKRLVKLTDDSGITGTVSDIMLVWIILLAFEADDPGSNPGGPVIPKNYGRIFFSTNGFKIMGIG